MAPSRRKRRLVLLGAPLAFVSTLVACNSIIGLTDFDKAECPGARCATIDGSPDQNVPDGGGGDGGDASLDAKGTDPTVWPKWPMPNYGEGGVGEPPRPLSYVDANGGVDLKDLVTNLVWRKAPLGESAKAADADAKCAGLGSDYRAPKRIELATLLDYGHGQPFIDPQFGVGLETVLTTSEVRAVNDDRTVRLTGQYWAVDFANGKVVAVPGTAAARILCVRSK